MSKFIALPQHATAYAPERLKPLVDPVIEKLLYASPHTLVALVAEHGSPLNLTWPHALKANVVALQDVLNKQGVRHEIFYGAKANKSQALISAAISANIGVDVSSIHEFQDALRAGARPDRLCATGPAKTEAFHEALVRNGSLISIDSEEEFDHLEAIVHRLAPLGKARVLLRYRPSSCNASRFGMDAKGLLRCLQRITEVQHLITFDGFHFHLSGYGFTDRAHALSELTPYIDAAREMGLAPRMIDIGGGLPMQYIEPHTYESFLQNNNNADDYDNNTVPSSFYPYGTAITACQWLQLFLDSTCQAALSVAQYLISQDLVLALEPGRSLVDQAAISIFRITRTKKLANEKTVIFVEGSSFSACETWFSSEFLIDPILISTQPDEAPTGITSPAYLAGHSCLDDDVITHRLINFSVTPKPGDLLVYVNTAGYQMDLLENEFHRHPLPRRMMATCCTQENLTFSPDY
ncbi:Y4yA family PLP-dependent enzyme [Pseudomonas sp. H11T01]|uniref:Y4yA family PLP-dependent enzyme n=1 Tax=Pseudomonas sp. H11T01 TaxID=3402749 RepID=UPI003ABEEFB4